jgi:hypothetical protein
VWDIIYEHTSYFTARSLSNVLENSGFRVRSVYEAFSDQYLCAEALPGAFCAGNGSLQESVAEHAAESREPDEEIARFTSGYGRYLEQWERRLGGLRAGGKRVAVWGAGSKGVTFLNTFDVRDLVECVVDINPKKQGMFVAGTGQSIVAPDGLVQVRPDTVLVVNPVYRGEVEGILGGMGLAPEIITL